MAISLNERRVYRTFCNPKREMNSIRSFNNVSMKYRYEQMKITALAQKLAGTINIDKRKKEVGHHIGSTFDKDLHKGQEILREIKKKRIIEKDENYEFEIKEKKKEKEIEQIKIASVMFNKYMDNMTQNKKKNVTLNHFRTFDYNSLDCFVHEVNNMFSENTDLIEKGKSHPKVDEAIDEKLIETDNMNRNKSQPIIETQTKRLKKKFKRFIGSNDFSLRKRPMNYTLNQFPTHRLSKINFNKHINQEEIDNPPIEFMFEKHNHQKINSIDYLNDQKKKIMAKTTKIFLPIKLSLSLRNLHSRNHPPIKNSYTSIDFTSRNNMNSTSDIKRDKLLIPSLSTIERNKTHRTNKEYSKTLTKLYKSCSDWESNHNTMNKTSFRSRNCFVPFFNSPTNQTFEKNKNYLSIDKINSINKYCNVLKQKTKNEKIVNFLRKERNDEFLLQLKIASSKIAFLQSNLHQMIGNHGQAFCDNVDKLTQPQYD